SKLSGYICVRSLPNFGSWNTFFSINIKKTMNDQEFTKPSLKISDCTKPSSEWTILLLISDPNKWSKTDVKTELKKQKIGYKDKENKCELVAALRKNIGEEIQKEVKGWALRECQEYGKRGSEKHMTKQVKQFLKTYFLLGDMDKKNRFTASTMLEELQKKVGTGELEADEIPKIKTVEN
ncbi:12406_t:CDS:2, partial [Dentiscutata heterogama]